jgi:hypothetical protein
MKPETAGKVKFGVWGLIVGAIIHDQNDDRRGGLGKSGGDLRRPIYEGTEP